MIPIANPKVGDEELAEIKEVFDSGMLADGPEVRSFEEEFADYCDASHGIAATNGTAALQAALHAVGVDEGDKILTTPFSYVATANAVRFCGAEPVFADIDPETYSLDPEVAEQVCREQNIDSILVVHLYGLPAKLDKLSEIAERYEIPLVEDAAQAVGAEFEGQRVGSVGDAGTFSFYPTKNMTTGEGGMITTDRDDVAERARSFVNHGRRDGVHESLGHNFRMSSIAAAIGRVQLQRLPDFTEKRRDNAAVLSSELADTNVEIPTEPEYAKHVYHQYTVRCDDRDNLQEHLEECGVGSAVYYDRCIHQEPAYSHINHSAPNAERAAEEVLSLPIHPGVNETDLNKIVDAVQSYNEAGL